MATHEEGIAIAEAYGEQHGIPWHILRLVASTDLSHDWPADEGMGSSDVSIHLSHMASRGDLQAQAKSYELIGRSARATGKSFEETFRLFQELFAPADEAVCP